MISSKTRDRFPIEEIHEAMHNEFIESKDFEAFNKEQISINESLVFISEVQGLLNGQQFRTAREHYVKSFNSLAYQNLLQECSKVLRKDLKLKETLHFRFGENDFNLNVWEQWNTQKI